MPTEMLIRQEQRATPALPPVLPPTSDERREDVRRYRRRVRRLKLNVAAWAVGTAVITTLWVANEWQANGVFERFGHEGDPGQWNPTLWAVVIGVWSLIVGIMALGVYFARPATDAELARFGRVRFRRAQALRFHITAWVLGVVLLTPVWALIEWQDNGGFERFSNDSTPGDWDPWILIVGGVWALAIVGIFAARAVSERAATDV